MADSESARLGSNPSPGVNFCMLQTSNLGTNDNGSSCMTEIKKSSTLRKFCMFFRLSNANQLFLLFLLGVVFYIQCLINYFPFDQALAIQRATLHVDVLAGHAPSPYQYQMYVPGLILETVLRFIPNKTALTFSQIYSHFCEIIFLVDLLFL